MSIVKRWMGGEQVFIPTCDICGDELGDDYDFYDAVESKKAAGWRSKKYGGDWIDMCPDCQKEQMRQDAVGDFTGIGGRNGRG